MAVKLVAGLLKDYDRDPLPRVLNTRVVTVWSQIKGMGLTGWGYTPQLGNSIRLLGVDVYFSPEQDGAGKQINYGFHVGNVKPLSSGQIRAWDTVLPVFMPDGKAAYFTQTQQSNPMSWTMNQLFTSKEIRFGTWINGSGMVTLCEMYTSFKIAEV
jgi:hypothetical protein